MNLKNIFPFLIIIGLLLITPSTILAQGMMWGYQGQATPSASELQEEQNMQDAGQKIYQNLQNKTITCQNLTNDDYEKLGEYYMGQAAGDTQSHVYWDQRIQAMMGDSGDTQMHIIWGQRGSGCLANAPVPSNTPSFIGGMMGNWNSGNQLQPNRTFPMMNYGFANYAGAFGILALVIPVLVIVFLVLGIIYFWQHIIKQRKT